MLYAPLVYYQGNTGKEKQMKTEQEIRAIINSLTKKLYELKIAHTLVTNELKTEPQNMHSSAKYIVARTYLTEIRYLEYTLYGLHLSLGEEYEVSHKIKINHNEQEITNEKQTKTD